MEKAEFSMFKLKFIQASIDEKVKLYAFTKGLTMGQYEELLRVYPMDQIEKLEKALA